MTPDLDLLVEELIRDVGRKYPGEYSDFKLHPEQGKTAVTVTARWNNGRRRVLKKNKPPVGRRSEANVKRGYDSLHALEFLSKIEEPWKHGITNVVGFGDDYIIEDMVDGPNLSELVKRDGPLRKKQLYKVGGSLLRTLTFLQQLEYEPEKRGIFHRDIKPDNIIVSDNYETTLTDFGNAGGVADTEESPDPTRGARGFSDSELCESLNGKLGKYDIQSEMYAFGASLLFAATGKRFFELDGDKHNEETGKQGVAVRLDTGESLLNEQGYISTGKFNNALRDIRRKHFRWKNRDLGRIIERCMTRDSSQKYQSLKELSDDFGRATRKSSWWKRAKYAAAGLALVAGGGLATIGTLTTLPTHQQRALLEDQGDKMPVYIWSETEGAIRNNAITLDVTASYNSDSGYKTLKAGSRGFLKPEFDDHITFELFAQTQPPVLKDYKGGIPLLTGTISIEGFTPQNLVSIYGSSPAAESDKKNTFQIRSRERQDLLSASTVSGAEYLRGRMRVSFQIPDEIPPGNYALAVELWAPTWAEVIADDMGDENIIRIDGKPIMNREVFHLVTGGADPIQINRLKIHKDEVQFYLENMDPDVKLDDEDVVYRASLLSGNILKPEMALPIKHTWRGGFSDHLLGSETDNSTAGVTVGLPGNRDCVLPDDGVIQLLGTRGDDIYVSRWLPVDIACGDPSGPRTFMTKFLPRIPTRDFAYKLAEYRERIIDDSR